MKTTLRIGALAIILIGLITPIRCVIGQLDTIGAAEAIASFLLVFAGIVALLASNDFK